MPVTLLPISFTAAANSVSRRPVMKVYPLSTALGLEPVSTREAQHPGFDIDEVEVMLDVDRFKVFMLNVTGMRAELIQTTGYELARNVIQFSPRLTPLLFFRLQSTDPRFCGLCRGHSRLATRMLCCWSIPPGHILI